jgi:hypothetical protein
MNTQTDAQLSSELQEIHLLNKQWLSDVFFLEDETRCFQKLFDSVLSSAIKKERFQEVQFVNASITELEERRTKLKALIIHYQHQVESVLVDSTEQMGLDFIKKNAAIANEIKMLFDSDKLIKRELYQLVESIIRQDKEGHLLNA